MKSTWKMTIAAMTFAASIFSANGQASAANYDYTVTDLGQAALTNLQGSYTMNSGTYKGTEVYGINDSGVVAGIVWAKFNGGTNMLRMTTTWTNGVPTVVGLPLVGGLSGKSDAWGINNFGQVVGYSNLSGTAHAFLYDTDANYNGGLGTHLPVSGYSNETANAINDAGAVVGYATKTGAQTAFLYSGGTTKVIPGADVTKSAANSINNNGLVTGYTAVSGNNRSFIYNSADNAFTTLGTLGGLASSGTDINDSGAVIGYSNLVNGVQHAFLYNGGTMIDLGALGSAANTSQANAINNAGTIVGASNGHAFVYSNGNMVDLNTLIDPAPGFTLTSATSINNLGQIVGLGTVGGVSHAFELTLVPTPIPPAVLLFGSGLAGLGLFRRRSRV
jgi:probable HAF family extracellular repeat protein